MGRKIIAVLAGVAAAGLIVLVVEVIGQALVVAQRDGQATTAMLGFVAFAWLLGSAGGALLAQRIDHGRRPVAALVTGALLLAIAIFNLVSFPHPAWFRVLGVLVFLPGTALGIWFGRRALPPRRTRRAAH